MKIYPKYKSWCSLRRCILEKQCIKKGIYFTKIQKIFCKQLINNYMEFDFLSFKYDLPKRFSTLLWKTF